MSLTLEPFDVSVHDPTTVAELIWEADPEMNALIYGDRSSAIEIIEAVMETESAFFSSKYLQVATEDGTVCGILVGFPVGEQNAIDNASGRAFARAMGLFSFALRMPTFFKLGKITGGDMDPDGYYVHHLAVGADHRSRGIGREIIERLGNDHDALYLHVNINNDRAKAFYERLGFVKRSHETISHRGREYGTYLMEWRPDNA
jgi:ribosomal protein S18 acetylase RimI-like enzyme